MAATLIDAGPLIALLDRTDPHHLAVVAAAKNIRGPRITVCPALTEAMYLLGHLWPAQRALWSMVEDGGIVLASLDASDAPRMRALMDRYRDLPMDLADAALVRIAERDGLKRILTVDRRDFSVYRIHDREPFELVLGP